MFKKDPKKRYINFAAMRVELQDLLLKETGNKITLLEGVKLEAWEIFNRGFSLSYLGRHEGAIACYNKALTINPAYSMSITIGEMLIMIKAISSRLFLITTRP